MLFQSRDFSSDLCGSIVAQKRSYRFWREGAHRRSAKPFRIARHDELTTRRSGRGRGHRVLKVGPREFERLLQDRSVDGGYSKHPQDCRDDPPGLGIAPLFPDQ